MPISKSDIEAKLMKFKLSTMRKNGKEIDNMSILLLKNVFIALLDGGEALTKLQEDRKL